MQALILFSLLSILFSGIPSKPEVRETASAVQAVVVTRTRSVPEQSLVIRGPEIGELLDLLFDGEDLPTWQEHSGAESRLEGEWYDLELFEATELADNAIIPQRIYVKVAQDKLLVNGIERPMTSELPTELDDFFTKRLSPPDFLPLD